MRSRLLPLVLVAGSVLGGAASARGQATIEVAWHGNVTNADRAGDRLDGWSVSAGLAGGGRRQIDRALAAVWRWHLEAVGWPQYPGLSRVGAEGSALAAWKTGVGAHWPVLQAGVSGGARGFAETARSQVFAALRAEARTRLGPAGQVSVVREWNRTDARLIALDAVAREWRLQWEPAWGGDLVLRAGILWREGDVVSYSRPPRPDLVEAGKVLTLVDTFRRGEPLLAYYFPARTRALTLEATWRLDARTSLRFEGLAAETEHKAVRYPNRRFTVGVVRGW